MDIPVRIMGMKRHEVGAHTHTPPDSLFVSAAVSLRTFLRTKAVKQRPVFGHWFRTLLLSLKSSGVLKTCVFSSGKELNITEPT